jgi:hypothetical protein
MAMALTGWPYEYMYRYITSIRIRIRPACYQIPKYVL